MRVSICSPRPILEECGLEDLRYQVDPYVGCGHYCLYCYALDDAETDWAEEVRRHEDVAGQLRGELSGIEPQTIYMGYKTDAYQPVEKKEFQTRSVLELLAEKGFSASILTKSDLVERDFDLLRRMPDARVGVSVAFRDDDRPLFERGTKRTQARIETLYRAKEAGLQTSALICPVIPFITDAPALLRALAPVADTIWVFGLSVRREEDENWRNVLSVLRTHYPERRAAIEEALLDRSHSFWPELKAELATMQAELALDLRLHL